MTAWLPSVRLATTQNLRANVFGQPLTPDTLDGVTVLVNDTILVKDQTDASQNGTWVATAPSGTAMTRRGDTFDPESILRVSEGDRNAHTSWALRAQGPIILHSGGGGSNLPFIRQDVKNYSFDSIAALKQFTASLVNATASVAGYHTPGDGGDGDFTFIGVSDGASITGATAESRTISAVANSAADPLGTVTITTSSDHDLGADIASVWLDGDITQGAVGVAGTITLTGPILVKIVDARSFKLVGRIFAAALGGGGATVRYVKVTTSGAHGHSPGERLSVSGIVPGNGALDINGSLFLGGVIDATHLTLAALSSGGTYLPGGTAVIGDDAQLVAATDADGTVGGAWKRNIVNPFNPKWWGARFDNLTDDLAALQAMNAAMSINGGQVEIPSQHAWLSDTWRISRPLQMRGLGGNGSESGFEIAPGRIAIRLESEGVSIDGLGSGYHVVKHIDVKSQILVHDTAFGHANGIGIYRVFTNGGTVRKGDCFVKGGEIDPMFFYRAMDTGKGASVGHFGDTEPAWTTMIGDVLVDSGITWVTEKFPELRKDAPAIYSAGDRVYAVDDNRHLFLCVSGGSAGPSPPAQMVGGNGAPGVAMWSTFRDGVGTLKWLVTIASGIHVSSGNGTIEHVQALGFTGSAIHLQGGAGQDVDGATYVDNFRLRDITVNLCGFGVYAGGDDANGYTIDALWGQNIGFVQPTPDDHNNGGKLFQDKSQAGGRVSDLYAQDLTGPAVIKNGSGRSTFLSCYHETGDPPQLSHFVTGQSTLIGGNLFPTPTSDSVVRIDQGSGFGIIETDSLSATTVRAWLTAQDGNHAPGPTVFRFDYNVTAPGGDNVNYYGLTYDAGAKGWWSLRHGPNSPANAFMLSTAFAGLETCPGWLAFPRGYLIGGGDALSNPPRFIGDIAVLTDRGLRAGRRRLGDQFRDATTLTTIASDTFNADPCYRGLPWSDFLGTTVGVGFAPYGIPPVICEPTANGSTPAAGNKVFKCIRQHLVTKPEPNWDAALAAGDPVKIEGLDTWELVGWTPPTIVTGNGQVTIAMDDADKTLSPRQAAPEIILVTGALRANRTLRFPAPTSDADSYQRTIRAGVSAHDLFVDVVGGASPITIAATKTAIVGFDATGAYRVTADV